MIQGENPITVDQVDEFQSPTSSSQVSTNTRCLMGPDRLIGGVKRRFAGDQRSSSHLRLTALHVILKV